MSRRFTLNQSNTAFANNSVSASHAILADTASVSITTNIQTIATASLALTSSVARVANQTYAGWAENFFPSDSGICAENFQDYPVGPISVFDRGIGWGNAGFGVSCSIVQVTGSGGVIEKRLRLSSGSMYVRNCGFGKNWSKVSTYFLMNHSATASYTGSKNAATTEWWALFGMCLGSSLTNSLYANPPSPINNSGSQLMGWSSFIDTNSNRIQSTTNFVQYNQTMSYTNFSFNRTVLKISGSGNAYPSAQSDTGTGGTLMSNTSSWASCWTTTITRPDPVALAAGTYTITTNAPASQTHVGHHADFATIFNLVRAQQGITTNFANSTGTSTNSITENGDFMDSVLSWWGGAISGSAPVSPTYVDLHGIIAVKQF